MKQQVHQWTSCDVQCWIKRIGFKEFASRFAKHKVDGSVLLHLTEIDLETDIGMTSGLQRKRFMKELENLIDDNRLSLAEKCLISFSPKVAVFDNKVEEMDDVKASTSSEFDVFISYRRSTGRHLASLIKVFLQNRGYKVFLDVEKLHSGDFGRSLLKNIEAAEHFILLLTPKSLDRLFQDENCEDWVHRELKCALENKKNIIPIFDEGFEFPKNEDQIPHDIRNITKYNGVKWVHDYQEACVAKVVRFIEEKLEMNTIPQNENIPISGFERACYSRRGLGEDYLNQSFQSTEAQPITPPASPSTISKKSSILQKIQNTVFSASERAKKRVFGEKK